MRGAFGATATKLRKIALDAPLFVAGAGEEEAVAHRVRGETLSGDPVVAAETLARVRHPQ